MTKKTEIAQIIKFYTKKDRLMISFYIAVHLDILPVKDICLLEIKIYKTSLENTGGGVGFSGHHLGIAPDIAG